ncbi:ubiquitin carboxyl-terminal hydrolase 47 isoform X1 [Hippoglossus stenolepis]|uniref:ubiquitin carboxyl-terminal hydrolase 47 isoform X1 n=1 Tax=Hippoglossus stenolepis TaxID=195615 RepID=UPI001FB01661|nr:ubiquitin carboxyl-terminal hydrolase 47 isoform X1 [Hippoglossus stenolepis]
MNPELVKTFREKLDNLTVSGKRHYMKPHVYESLMMTVVSLDYHGLHSPGLTCYLNTVLQLLFMTEDFRASIKRCCSKDSTTIDALLKKLFDDLERRLARTHCLTKKLGIVDVYEQRDAAEYFEKILCLTSPEASKIFKGELNHKTTCGGCKKKSDSRGFFWILPLAMEDSSRQTYSVERGLTAFFRKDKVCGENRMYCTECDKKHDADLECEMTQNPKILTLLLKRFTFDYKCRHYVKLHCQVDVPQTLHMKNCKYDLYALVNHLGNLTGGHYTAEIRSFETGEWYCFNDNIVDRVKPLFGSGNGSVRSDSAYLLMYRKDVEAERRHDEAERGDAPDPHRTPRDESGCGGENMKHLKNSCSGDSPRELEQQPNQGEACGRRHKDAEVDGEKSHFSKSQKDGGCEPNRRHLKTNSEPITAHFVDSTSEQTHSYQNKRLQREDITWDKTGSSPRVEPSESKHVKNKREVAAEINIEGKDTVKPCQVSPIHCSSCRVNEPAACGSSPPLRRHSGNVQRNEGEGRKLEATETGTAGAKTASERKRKRMKTSQETRKQEPWR